MSYIIYKHTNTVSKKYYIGVTQNTIQFRWVQHINNALANRVPNSALYKAIRKHGVDTWTHEELAVIVNKDEAFLTEMKLIKEHGAFGPNGYNMTIGGEGSPARVITKAFRNKIRLTRLGTTSSEKAKSKISASLKGNKRRLGIKHTAETIDKLSGATACGFKPWYISSKDKTLLFFDITKKEYAMGNGISVNNISKRFLKKNIGRIAKKGFWKGLSCGNIPTENGMPIMEAGKR